MMPVAPSLGRSKLHTRRVSVPALWNDETAQDFEGHNLLDEYLEPHTGSELPPRSPAAEGADSKTSRTRATDLVSSSEVMNPELRR